MLPLILLAKIIKLTILLKSDSPKIKNNLVKDLALRSDGKPSTGEIIY
jgi:hypothetical protein